VCVDAVWMCVLWKSKQGRLWSEEIRVCVCVRGDGSARCLEFCSLPASHPTAVALETHTHTHYPCLTPPHQMFGRSWPVCYSETRTLFCCLYWTLSAAESLIWSQLCHNVVYASDWTENHHHFTSSVILTLH